MSNFPTMTAEVTFPIPGQLARVDVTHAPAQSYSKAVQPRAMREARKVLRGCWVVCTIDYHGEQPATGRCTTSYYLVGATHGENVNDVAKRGEALVDALNAPVTGDQVRNSPAFAALSPEAREVIARNAEQATA